MALDHISVGTHDYPRAVQFYGHALLPLGMSLQRDTGAEAAFGTPTQWSFFLYPVPAEQKITAPGAHLAFAAPSRAVVQAVYAAAIAASAQDIFTPRLRPDINATYFGAMFTDLDGHRIEVLTHAG
jgi:catechol 2,3-dioxygenase-like lactoylglutathione lyase family enzyme